MVGFLVEEQAPAYHLSTPPYAYTGSVKMRSVDTRIYLCRKIRLDFKYSIADKTRSYQGLRNVVRGLRGTCVL